MHAVEFEQMRVHLGGAQIIDRHEVEILTAGLQIRPERKPADAAKPVDGDALVRHFSSLFPSLGQITRGGRHGLARDSEMLIKLWRGRRSPKSMHADKDAAVAEPFRPAKGHRGLHRNARGLS